MAAGAFRYPGTMPEYETDWDRTAGKHRYKPSLNPIMKAARDKCDSWERLQEQANLKKPNDNAALNWLRKEASSLLEIIKAVKDDVPDRSNEIAYMEHLRSAYREDIGLKVVY